jgi:O-antigen/teichoic acid export membrane protein
MVPVVLTESSTDAIVEASAPRTVFTRYSRGVAWSLVGTAVGRGITLLATIVLARMLGPASYGRWGVIQSTIGTGAALAGFGATLTATKQVAQHRNTAPDAAAGRAVLALVLAGGGGLLGATIMVLVANPFANLMFPGASLGPLIRLGAGALAFGILGGAQVGVLIGLEAFPSACVVTVVRGVAMALGVIAGALMFGVAGAVAAGSVGELAGAAAGYGATRRACRRAGLHLDLRLAWRERVTFWRFSLPAFVASACTQPAMWIGQVALMHRSEGVVQAGYFAFASRWYLFVLFFSSTIAPVGLSVLSNLRSTATPAAHARFLRVVIGINIAVVIPPALGVVLLAVPLCRFGGPGYSAAAPTVVVLALTCVPAALNTVLSQAALSLDRVRAWVLSDVALAVTLATLSICLAPGLGSLGVAFANLAGMIVTCVVLVGPVATATRRPPRSSPVGKTPERVSSA